MLAVGFCVFGLQGDCSTHFAHPAANIGKQSVFLRTLTKSSEN